MLAHSSATLASVNLNPGADPGDLWGLKTPFQSVLILKQALQIIILIGTKYVIINLLYFKAPEPA